MDRIHDRAAQWGIDTRYHDAFGRLREVPPETLRQLTSLIGGEDEPARRRLPRTVVLRRNHEPKLSVAAHHGMHVAWTVAGRDVIARGEGHAPDLWLPKDLPIGTFTLRVDFGDGAEDATLLVTPERAFQGDSGARVWGIAVQLYGVRSESNWGHGDFTDLAGLIDIAAACGAAAIGLNPLHALFDNHGEDTSPYSPNSRLFLNTRYIDVEAVPGFPGLDASGLRDEVERLRDCEFVDYHGVSKAKEQGLRIAYEAFRAGNSADQKSAFQTFRAERGETLQRFAAFEWLRRKHGLPWQSWSAEWRDADARALANLRRDHEDEIAFFEFLQWAAHQQLTACCERIRQRGLSIGLYLDVAVGVSIAGFDAWSNRVSVIDTVSVGAPPDNLNVEGQNWGLAGTNPIALEEEAFEPFRRMLQESMHYAGAVRLDHVLGLKRLFLVPRGVSAAEGTYVRFPFESLLAVAVQESVSDRCIIIGEDLGTVPEGFRETLADWGIWSYKVMVFEREHDGGFRAPEAYQAEALASFNTHDLATFAAWVTDHDLRVKRGIGMDPGESEHDRERARAGLRRALGVSHAADADFPAVAAYLARTPSRLVIAAMEDVLGLLDQPNIPGTLQEHPNWRRRLPVTLEELAGDRRLAALAEIMAASGRRR